MLYPLNLLWTVSYDLELIQPHSQAIIKMVWEWDQHSSGSIRHSPQGILQWWQADPLASWGTYRTKALCWQPGHTDCCRRFVLQCDYKKKGLEECIRGVWKDCRCGHKVRNWGWELYNLGDYIVEILALNFRSRFCLTVSPHKAARQNSELKAWV